MAPWLQVPGDGRELVATDALAVKIRAEDGRRVQAVDISPFIRNLPFGESGTVRCAGKAAAGHDMQVTTLQPFIMCSEEPRNPFMP